MSLNSHLTIVKISELRKITKIRHHGLMSPAAKWSKNIEIEEGIPDQQKSYWGVVSFCFHEPITLKTCL